MLPRVLGFQNIQVCVVWILGLKVMTVLVQLRKSRTSLPLRGILRVTLLLLLRESDDPIEVGFLTTYCDNNRKPFRALLDVGILRKSRNHVYGARKNNVLTTLKFFGVFTSGGLVKDKKCSELGTDLKGCELYVPKKMGGSQNIKKEELKKEEMKQDHCETHHRRAGKDQNLGRTGKEQKWRNFGLLTDMETEIINPREGSVMFYDNTAGLFGTRFLPTLPTSEDTLSILKNYRGLPKLDNWFQLDCLFLRFITIFTVTVYGFCAAVLK
ncbi:hypothetical protein LXL04_024860 [Taraxacum kok-saghyz]